MQQRPGKSHALGLSPREGLHAGVGQGGGADGLQGPGHSVAGVAHRVQSDAKKTRFSATVSFRYSPVRCETSPTLPRHPGSAPDTGEPSSNTSP